MVRVTFKVLHQPMHPRNLIRAFPRDLRNVFRKDENTAVQSTTPCHRHCGSNDARHAETAMNLKHLNEAFKSRVDSISSQPVQKQLVKVTSDILLLTYLRSGSTWLGEISRKANNSFYVYEPFKKLIEEGIYAKGALCFKNNTCRKPRQDFESEEFLIASFRQIYTCDFLNMHKRVLYMVMSTQKDECPENSVNSDSMNTGFNRTIRSKRPPGCIHYVINKCLQADYRIVKTIRMSMELVKPLMDDVRNLKIIHLVRDPRGITNSRLRGSFSMTKDDESHSKNLCNRMYSDVTIGDQLRKMYPTNFALVMYEALAEKPLEGARFIFKFLNATYDEKVQEWVYESSHGSFNGFYLTTRNSTEAFSHWRRELGFTRTAIIQSNCPMLFNLLGYIPFKSMTELTDTSIKARKTVDIVGFV